MPGKQKIAIPLGLPDQNDGPTAPIDRGDETQDRFRYQWAMGAVLLAEGISKKSDSVAIWCEHHEDFLVELVTGNFLAIQVKTAGQENARWHVTSAAFVDSVKRFCTLEASHSKRIDQYQFCSNAPVHVPGAATKASVTLSRSPMRLIDACEKVAVSTEIKPPYKAVFDALVASTNAKPPVLLAVLKKLKFRQGPALRGYMDTLIAKTAPSLPNCSALPTSRLQKICRELMRLIETASGIPTGGPDGVLAFIAKNGKPELSIRGKCITLDLARACIEQARQVTFQYVARGSGLPLGHVTGQRDVLHKKMRNAFLEGQFESIWWRALSAEKRLMEKALVNAEEFESFANQLEGTVLIECKDAEALAALEADERKRGLTIYRDIVQRLTDISNNEPIRVEGEPKDTLIGVAGMLSGSCRFAWGVPLDEDDDGL